MTLVAYMTSGKPSLGAVKSAAYDLNHIAKGRTFKYTKNIWDIFLLRLLAPKLL